MKNISFISLVVLSAIFCFTSCQKEALENDLFPIESVENNFSDIDASIRTGDETPLEKTCECENNLVKNGGFTEGTIGGNTNIPANNPDAWHKGYGSPQYYDQMGYSTNRYIAMWGNQTVGEAIYQQMQFVKGRTYEFCFAYQSRGRADINKQEYMRIKLRAAKANNLTSPTGGTVIGISQDAQTTDGWTLATITWTADDDYDYLYISPENEFAVNDGGLTSWGVIDDICVKEIPLETCECENNLVQNGDFTEGTIGGNTNIPANNPAAWHKGYGSPQYYDQMGYSTNRYIAMWGNQTVGEAIYQQMQFVKGRTYEFCFAYQSRGRADINKQEYMRIKLRAAKANNLTSPSGGTVIGISQDAQTTDGWTLATITWTADDDYDYLYISPENEFAVNDGRLTSWGVIDDICVKEVCEDLTVYTDFQLVSANVNGNVISQAIFQAPATLPQGAVHWWNVFDGESCDDDGNYSILNENSNPVELRNTHYGNTFTINSPDGSFPDLEINKCYIIKHGVYKDGCGWVETRAKFRVTFSTNLKTGEPTIRFLSESSIEQPNENNNLTN